MPWGAAIGALGSVAAAKMSQNKNGGAGTTTASKEPWEAAAPWLKDLTQQGSNLATGYLTNPFRERQTAAYDSQYGLSEGMRGLIPSLLGQLGSQQVGFDPKNPTARPQAFDWGTIINSLAGSQRSVQPTMGATSASAISSGSQAPAMPAAVAPKDEWNLNGLLAYDPNWRTPR